LTFFFLEKKKSKGKKEEKKGKEKKRIRKTDLDDLPNESQNQVGSSGNNVLGVNVDDIATNSASGVQHEGVVLRDLNWVRGLLVDGALVNGLGDGVVDELAEEDSVAAGLEEGISLLGNGEDGLEVGVILQGVVDPVDEGELLLVGVRVSSSISGGGRGSTKNVDVSSLLHNGTKSAGLSTPALSDDLIKYKYTIYIKSNQSKRKRRRRKKKKRWACFVCCFNFSFVHFNLYSSHYSLFIIHYSFIFFFEFTFQIIGSFSWFSLFDFFAILKIIELLKQIILPQKKKLL
jgi:hypothetical protein